ncbi:outer membrane beta-barrel protein [Ornithobacterium rhinotracheale]|uniref:outer membrane beta-barrel protein n=1 Tax=Ornithobacterium rhinotracheale TaxID=28251 RepID=UPI001FF1C8E1|nr:outer membrane beta-barrel protein [Ornithobacterium rhinotracheale]MCK0201626.1 outer membrane beta-barrel protein [Ornithobacterium rhinotracheale]
MKYFISSIFCLLSISNLYGQENKNSYFMELGANSSHLFAFSDISSLQLLSGNKLGYYVGVGKIYGMSKQWDISVLAKLSETGGKIENTTYFIKQKFNKDIEKYRNATIKVSLYRLSSDINLNYNIDKTSIYTGLQPSILFFGVYKELSTTSDDGDVPGGGGSGGGIPNDDEVSRIRKNINIFQLRYQIGVKYKLSSKYSVNLSYYTDLINNLSLYVPEIKNEIRFRQSTVQLGIIRFF